MARTRSLSPVPTRGGRRPGQDPDSRDRGRGRSPAAPRGGGARGRSVSPKQEQSKSVEASPPPGGPPVVRIGGPPNLLDHGYGNLPLSAIPEHDDDNDFLKAVKRCIPSEFVLIASQDDVSKAQEDFFAMEHFKLKPPEGQTRWSNSQMAGSVATCALLQLMYENPKAMMAPSSNGNHNDDDENKPWSTLEILQEMQNRIKFCTNKDANPTISSSRPLGPPRFDEGVYAPYYIVPPDFSKGTRRALLIGCVTGGENDLKGTLNDVYNIKRFLVDHCGFETENIVSLTESPKNPAHEQPTKKNIVDGFAKLIRESKEGDVNFIQFSGHGSRSDTNLYIIPCDFARNGYIMDDKILKNLIKAMPGGVYTTMLVDCCYSGTVCDLPYILKPSSTEQEIERHFRTSIKINKHQLPPPTRRRMPSQKVQSFYNLDTIDETREKEEKGGDDYKKLEQARKQKRSWMQFEPKKLMDWDHSKASAKSMANKTKKGFIKGFAAVGEAVQDATEMAIEATAQASDAVIDVTKKTTARIGRSKSPVPFIGRSRSTNTPTDDGHKATSTTKQSPKRSQTDGGTRPRSKSPVPSKPDDDIPAPSVKKSPRPRSKNPVPRRLVDDDIPVAARAKDVPTRPRSKSPVPSKLDDDIPTPSVKKNPRPRSKNPVPRREEAPAPSGKKNHDEANAAPVKPRNSKGNSSTPSTQSKAAAAAPVKPPTGSTMKHGAVVSSSSGDDNDKDSDDEALSREFEEAANKAAKERGNHAQAQDGTAAPSSSSAEAAAAPKTADFDWKQHKKTSKGKSRSKSPTRRQE